MKSEELFQQQYNTIAKNQDWLTEIRQQAWEDFQQQGIPTPRQENWKYSNVGPIFKRDLSIPNEVEINLSEIIHQNAIESFDCYRLVILDGKFIAEFSQLPTENELQIIPLSYHGGADYKKVIDGSIAQFNKKHPFAALNTALAAEGLLIHIKSNLHKPLELLYISSAQQADAFIQAQSLVVVNENANATLVERFISAGDARYLLNSRCDILLKENAQLTHVRFENQSAQATHLRFIGVTQCRASHFDSYAFDFGGQFVRTDLVTRLSEKQSSCALQGVYVVNEKQHVDNHTMIEHIAPECSSRQFYKGIIADSARAVFNGKVIVQNTAQKTDASQNNKNLLLSKTAEIDTKPELEIYADEVKCAHGSTVGQLNEEAVFYLQARGISETSARSLMTYAFAEELIAQLPHQALVAWARECLMKKLPEGEVVREYLA
jgi:Fe-S cluster assembly protein SufD